MAESQQCKKWAAVWSTSKPGKKKKQIIVYEIKGRKLDRKLKLLIVYLSKTPPFFGYLYCSSPIWPFLSGHALMEVYI